MCHRVYTHVPPPPPLEASRPVSSSEELLHKQEVKATCDSHWPAGSCRRAALSTLELDQREPPRAHTSIWIHGEERKQRPVGTVSSLAEWANWEVKSLICSPALVAPSINSLACVCVCVLKHFVFPRQLSLSISSNQVFVLAQSAVARSV